MMKLSILPASQFISARKDPTVYPGERPSGSYLLLGDNVHLIKFRDPGDVHSAQIQQSKDGEWANVDAVLASHGAAKLDERFVVIGYGSNRCPGQLLKKWADARADKKNYPDEVCRTIQDIVPVFKGTLPHIAVVVEQFISYGTPYAGILENALTHGRTTEVWLTLLDRAQFLAMNQSERVNDANPLYKVAEFPGFGFDKAELRHETKTIAPLGYAGNSTVFNSKTHGTPICFRDVKSEGGTTPLPSYHSPEALALILQEGGLTDAVLRMAGVTGVVDLMRELNRQWNAKQPNREVSDMIVDYIKGNSIDSKLADQKVAAGLVINDPNDPPDKYKFGNLVP